MNLEAFINNKLAQPQEDWQSMTLTADFKSGQQSISVETITLSGENGEAVNEYLQQGLSGENVGITEGVPFRLVLNGVEIFNGCFDTASASYSCDRVTGGTRQRKGFDFLTQRAQSFRFAYLAEIGTITPDMYVPKNYVVGRYPKVIEIFLAFFTLYSLTVEIIRVVKAVIDVISAIAGGISGIAEAVAQAIGLVIYLVGLVTAMIAMLKQFIDLLFPFVYYHNAMNVWKQIELGCQHLGLGFSSSFAEGEYKDLCIEPPKNIEGVKTGQLSTDQGEFDGTLSELLQLMRDLFAAEIQVIDEVVYLEQWPFYQKLSDQQLKPIYIDEFKTNAPDIESNYFLKFSYDPADIWSYEVTKGNNIQVTREQITTNDKGNVLLEGLEQPNVFFVKPNIVKKITAFEIAMGKLWNVVAKVVTVFKKAINKIKKAVRGSKAKKLPATPKIPPFGSLGADRQDTHFTNNRRIFISGKDGRIDYSTEDVLAAEYLYENFHSIYSPLPSKSLNLGNQWYKYEGVEMEMCPSEFFGFTENHYSTYEGLAARILKIEWNPFLNQAKVDFEVNKRWSNNLKETKVIDGGN